MSHSSVSCENVFGKQNVLTCTLCDISRNVSKFAKQVFNVCINEKHVSGFEAKHSNPLHGLDAPTSPVDIMDSHLILPPFATAQGFL